MRRGTLRVSGSAVGGKQEAASINRSRHHWEVKLTRADLFFLCILPLGELTHFNVYDQHLYVGDLPVYTSNATSPLRCSPA